MTEQPKLFVSTQWWLVEIRGDVGYDFEKLRTVARKYRGYYQSRTSTFGAGFAFAKREDADAFCADEKALSFIR